MDGEKDWIFVSDAHFTERDREAMEGFEAFLDRERDRMGHLVLLGDLFEFLFGFRGGGEEGKAFPYPAYLSLLDRLQRLGQEGVRITYVEGNHDFFLQPLFRGWLKLEAEIVPLGKEERIGDRRAYVAHGDLANPHLWGYRIYRRMIKNRLTYGLIEAVGPAFSKRVARWLSERSFNKNHAAPASAPPPEFRRFAHRKFSEGFDLVILGHSHVPDQWEVILEGRRCLYFNTGEWRERRSFLRFTPPDRFRLERWEGTPLRDRHGT
ncbi:MAG: UDP-2,3-diacylglucosamine diphosphatase [Desulfobacterota bacterium]|nr:UDP-2,3-diacylglucosamine diphosphatase [Thermodesulfobacteriota bacterium]